MEPVTVNCSSSCTVTHVVTLDIPFFQLDAAGGLAIAGAILAVWTVGFCIRLLIQTLRYTDSNSPNHESE